MQEIDRYLSPAKINLGLEVLYERPDGYHEINTCFVRVLEPHDSVSVTRSGFFRLTCSDPTLPVDSSNLMMKAALAFEKLAGHTLPRIHVHLEKVIPMGAGLGGGSSNAASMLQILCDRSEAPPSSVDVMKIAAKIGADVPFFLAGNKIARAGGIGEELTPLSIELPLTILIVVNPTIQISTKDAYALLSPSPEPSQVDYISFFDDPPALSQWKEKLRNDFEPEIFRRIPKLGMIKHAMYSRGAVFALMSGSGSSIYGLFENPELAESAKQKFLEEKLLAFLS